MTGLFYLVGVLEAGVTSPNGKRDRTLDVTASRDLLGKLRSARESGGFAPVSEPPGGIGYQESGGCGRKGHARVALLKFDDHLAGVAALEKLKECGRHVAVALAHCGLERD